VSPEEPNGPTDLGPSVEPLSLDGMVIGGGRAADLTFLVGEQAGPDGPAELLRFPYFPADPDDPVAGLVVPPYSSEIVERVPLPDGTLEIDVSADGTVVLVRTGTSVVILDAISGATLAEVRATVIAAST
jgi:hypothetical protein